MPDAVKETLFICYSHTDQKYREQFEKYLQAEALKGLTFSDTQIKPGEDWLDTILKKLEQATAALVLVSQDTLISPFIQQVELRAIMERHIRRGLRLFLVPLAPTLYQGSALERFQWALPPDKPLSSMSETDQQKAIVDVCLRIAKEVGALPDTPTIDRTIECLKSIPRLDLPSTFELLEPLGQGQYSRCFRGQDRMLNRPVIIKVLNTPLTRDSAAYDKYVASAARLDHPNILGVYFSEANKLPNFIVTPDVGDVTLEKKMADPDTRPALDVALTWTVRLAQTLAHAHRKKCVHGRLRPCEIRFHQGQPILAGFRTIESCELESAAVPDLRLALEDFRYASPEYRASGVIDAKGDQYLLGLIAYEMIAGVSPVPLPNWASLLDPAVLSKLLAPHPLSTKLPGCDTRVSDVVMRMLHSDPRARWDSMDDVARRLEDVLTNASSVALAKESYRRFAQDLAFYDELYTRLFNRIPGMEAMFKTRTSAEQQDVLRDAVWLLLNYAGTTAQEEEPTVLSRVARKHGSVPDVYFDTFLEIFLDLVGQRDPSAAEAWNYAMAPGLKYLKERALKTAQAGV